MGSCINRSSRVLRFRRENLAEIERMRADFPIPCEILSLKHASLHLALFLFQCRGQHTTEQLLDFLLQLLSNPSFAIKLLQEIFSRVDCASVRRGGAREQGQRDIKLYCIVRLCSCRHFKTPRILVTLRGQNSLQRDTPQIKNTSAYVC